MQDYENCPWNIRKVLLDNEDEEAFVSLLDMLLRLLGLEIDERGPYHRLIIEDRCQTLDSMNRQAMRFLRGVGGRGEV
jgi:hypothetical protein